MRRIHMRLGRLRFVMAVASVGLTAGCADLTGAPELPAGTEDPAAFETAAGARGLHNRSLNLVTRALAAATFSGGMLTDELEMDVVPLFDAPLTTTARLDLRMPAGEANPYERLQGARNSSAYAIAALRQWGAQLPSSLAAEMYALQAYTELHLAELFCSGVPLSTVSLAGGFSYEPGSPTANVHEHAIALFDTAITLAGDSARIADLARVGKGRALLHLGRFSEAEAAVAPVALSYSYGLPVVWRSEPGTPNDNYSILGSASCVTVTDREGGTGYPYVTGDDPRTRVVELPAPETGYCSEAFSVRFIPEKYDSATPVSLVIASGIEAQLIRSEARFGLRSGDWLSPLNTLRTSAGVSDLPPLDDPGTDTARLRMILDERAAWLFLTGHRQGDLRRSVRVHEQPREWAYPTGLHRGSTYFYGSEVTLPIPDTEYENPKFQGCLNRGA